MTELLAQLADFDVSATLGFLPASILDSLPSPYFSPWEATAARIPDLLKEQTLRETVESLPLLESAALDSEMEWKRAYVVLGYICNAYLFCTSPPAHVRAPI
jgi:indoleamine 2,3-dioxygenase